MSNGVKEIDTTLEILYLDVISGEYHVPNFFGLIGKPFVSQSIIANIIMYYHVKYLYHSII